jgi:cytohesin
VGVNAPDKDHAALLRLACYCGRLDVVHELLNNGAKANSENFLGENALHLLSQGEYGSQEDGVRIVRELVERGVDINAQCKHYRTPLHLVSYFGRPAATQVLLDYSAKPNVMDEHGEIPLHLLSRGKYYSQDDAVRVALLLIECGADVNARDMKLRTPLHNASYNGNVAIAQVLLEHRGTPHARDSNGKSPLHLVLQGKDDSEECGTIARLLLEHGADVDAQDGRNVTPLDLSSRLQKPKIAKMLAEHSANF